MKWVGIFLALIMCASSQNAYAQGAALVQKPITTGHCASWITPNLIQDSGFSCVNGAIVLGNPTGGSEGAGTLNAQGLYVNGQLVTTGGPFLPLTGGTLTGNLTLAGFSAANSLYNVFPTNTGSPNRGLFSDIDSLWNPAPPTGVYNDYFHLELQNVSMAGGSVSTRWLTANNVNSTRFVTTGPPMGTPTTPTGMADSHAGGYNIVGIIPAGLCDGQDGNGFTGTGGSPGNNCYQEIDGLESTQIILSPGHYSEGVGSYIYDNLGGSGAVPIRGNALFADINKDSATSTYPLIGVVASSDGTQQTTFAPDAAFYAAGGWQVGLDLSHGVYNQEAILFPNSQKIVSSSGMLNFNIGSSYMSITGSANGTSLLISDQGTSGAVIGMIGNGATTPTKYLQVQNGVLQVLNSAASAAIFFLSDIGTLAVPNLTLINVSTGSGGHTLCGGPGVPTYYTTTTC